MEIKENKLIPNSTQIPNIILDLIVPRIPGGEMRCLIYICRRTYGFHKERDRISLTQFVMGIKDRDGKQIDYGVGISRPAVVEALKNLTGAEIAKVIKTPRGNYYEINLGLFSGKDGEKLADEVVKKVNQLRKLTKTGKESKPKQVKLLNLQKKGNKGNKVILLPEAEKQKKSDEHFRISDEVFVENEKTFKGMKKPPISLLMRLVNECGENEVVDALGKIRLYLQSGGQIKDPTPYLISVCKKNADNN